MDLPRVCGALHRRIRRTPLYWRARWEICRRWHNGLAWSRTHLVSRALLGDCLLVHAALRRYPPLPSDVLVAPAICRVAQPAAAKAAASEAAAKALINAGAWWKDARKDAVQAAEVVVGKVLRRRCARCVEGCKGPRRLLVDWRRQRAALSVTAAVPRRSDGQEQEHGLKTHK